METYRDQFHIPEGIYLLNHALGCLPQKTLEASNDFIKTWQTQAAYAWEYWQDEIVKFNEALAVLFNTQATLICPQSNISSAAAKIIYSLQAPSKRKTIVLAEQDFPSLGFLYQATKPYGYELKYFPKQIPLHDLELWNTLLDDKVQWLHISHASSHGSEIAPISDLVQMARERDIFTIIDVAQSAGVIPLDLTKLNAHFVIGSCIKWLCGGPGAGFLWLHPDMIPQCAPRDLGWFSHQDPFEFDIHHFEYAHDARRFWGGTPSVQAFMLARHSIELIHSIGVNEIRQHNKNLLHYLRSALSKYTDKERECERGGTFCLQHKNIDSLMTTLRNKNIHVDKRACGLRLSPHIYNTEAELEQTIDAICQYLG